MKRFSVGCSIVLFLAAGLLAHGVARTQAMEIPGSILHFQEEGASRVAVEVFEQDSPRPDVRILKGVAADALDVEVEETLEARGEDRVVRSRLTVTARRPVSFLLSRTLRFSPQDQPVFMSPGVIYNTNNAARSDGKYPQLVYRGPIGTPESSVFHYRADRSSHCAVMAIFDGRVMAMSIEEGTRVGGRFYYNGLGVDTSQEGGDLLVVHMGYVNFPARYNGNTSPRLAPRWDDEPGYGWIWMDTGESAVVEALIYDGEAVDVFAYEKPLRVFYEFLRGETLSRDDPAAIAKLIGDAIIDDAVVEESGLFRVTDTSTECDIGWTGGMMVAGPLLAWGNHSGDERAITTALRAMDVLCNEGFNAPASLFFDAWREGEWTVDGWWRNWAGGHHLAYTNGQAVYFLLTAWESLTPDEQKTRGIWLERCQAVLSTALRHQRATGEFPASYSPIDGSPGSIDGFGGCWFLPAMLKAYQVFADTQYLNSAIRAEKFYFNQLHTLEVWGTPIDAEGAVEMEGNLPLVKGERLLYEITGETRYLDHLERAINYDLSWKWAYNTNLENPPLRDLDWLSQGGNGASTCNVHLHPMSNMILDDLWSLAERTGDDFYAQRYRDALDFGMGCINLFDGHFGFGKAGWGSEQFFHTDALQGQEPRDGGIWTRYLCWATAAVLHSIVTLPAHDSLPE